MYTENYDHETNKINIDKIIDSIDLETWDEDDFFDDNEEWNDDNEEI